MSSFKDILRMDIEKTFMNINEFAEKHRWNKGEIVCIEDDETLIAKYSAEFELLPQGSHLIYVSCTQFSKNPIINEVVVYDGTLYTIDEVHINCGIFTIFLKRKG